MTFGGTTADASAVGSVLPESLRHAPAVMRCMRYLQTDSAKAKLSIVEKQEVDAALDPPLPLVVCSGVVYGCFFVGLRRASSQMRARPLVLQMASCLPAAALLCMGGFWQCRGMLRGIMQRSEGTEATAGSLRDDLLERCGILRLPA
eukprot:TRINITY_DN63706_c0_g1_i1.p1 TRINITY_DN63706_c0_g1~~TRINITY_DN63706_c0_g1_i1.p1  ORF type:complete len:157 (-),score=23.98 TRINITY_DN63706_c0_g1_i1:58-498(-)